MARIAVIAEQLGRIETLCDDLAEFDHDIERLAYSRSGLEALRKSDRELVLFYWPTDDLGTASFFAGLRRETRLPLFCLTGAHDEMLTVAALRGGADACISLSVSAVELNARIKAQLRRFAIWTQAQEAATVNQEISLASDAVVVEGRPVELSAIERRLLERLQSDSGTVVTRDDLCDHVWGTDAQERYTNLSLVVYNLRKKLERNPHHPRYLLTKWGVGYYLSQEFGRNH